MQIGDGPLGRLELERATALQPDNPDAWIALAEYDLSTLHQPAAALREFTRAQQLDPGAGSVSQGIEAATAAISR